METDAFRKRNLLAASYTRFVHDVTVSVSCLLSSLSAILSPERTLRRSDCWVTHAVLLKSTMTTTAERDAIDHFLPELVESLAQAMTVVLTQLETKKVIVGAMRDLIENASTRDDRALKTIQSLEVRDNGFYWLVWVLVHPCGLEKLANQLCDRAGHGKLASSYLESEKPQLGL